MSETSVYEKALRVQNDARRLADGQAGQREAQRITRRVAELRSQLENLRTRLGLARLIGETTGETVDLSGRAAGFVEFERKARPGDQPTDGVFTKASSKVKTVCAALDQQINTVWSTWARTQVGALPAARLSLLSQKERTTARKRLAELERAATDSGVSRSDVEIFKTSLNTLAELLAEAKDVPEEVARLLDRISQPPPLTLAEITDEQIGLLRAAGLADEVSLMRKGI